MMEKMTTALDARVAQVRDWINAEHDDPRGLFDEVQRVVDLLTENGLRVPDDLREYVAELEAEIVEDFYDNLPV